MNNFLNLLADENSKIKIASVYFNGNTARRYSYLTNLELEEGDKVVIVAPTGDLMVVEVASLEELHTYDKGFKLKWIVSKIDFTNYENCLELDKAVDSLIVNIARKERKDTFWEKAKEVDLEAATSILETVKRL